MDDPKPLLYSRKDAAKVLGISVRMIDYLLEQGKLPAKKIGKRTLIPVSAVEKMAKI